MNIPVRTTEKALIPRFTKLTAQTRQSLIDTAKAYNPATMTKEELKTNLGRVLEAAHSKAAALGRVLAESGGAGRVGGIDKEFGAWALGQQQQYLDGFADDIAAGKYSAGANADAISIARAFNALAHRSMLYARGLRATAEEAWIYTLPDGTRFIWVLGSGVEQHCEVCPDYARKSQRKPYTYDTLPTVPGGMQTPCGVNCDCRLQTLDGKRSFPFVILLGDANFGIEKTSVGNGGDIALQNEPTLRIGSEKGLDVMFSTDRVVRTGKVFQVGSYPDKNFALSEAEAEAAVAAFKPTPANLEHKPTPFDGAYGGLQKLWKQGAELFGEVFIPKWADEHLREKGVPLQPSLEWDRNTKTVRGVAWVNFPRIEDAALMSKFSGAFDGEVIDDPAVFWIDPVEVQDGQIADFDFQGSMHVDAGIGNDQDSVAKKPVKGGARDTSGKFHPADGPNKHPFLRSLDSAEDHLDNGDKLAAANTLYRAWDAVPNHPATEHSNLASLKCHQNEPDDMIRPLIEKARTMFVGSRKGSVDMSAFASNDTISWDQPATEGDMTGTSGYGTYIIRPTFNSTTKKFGPPYRVECRAYDPLMPGMLGVAVQLGIFESLDEAKSAAITHLAAYAANYSKNLETLYGDDYLPYLGTVRFKKSSVPTPERWSAGDPPTGFPTEEPKPGTPHVAKINGMTKTIAQNPPIDGKNYMAAAQTLLQVLQMNPGDTLLQKLVMEYTKKASTGAQSFLVNHGKKDDDGQPMQTYHGSYEDAVNAAQNDPDGDGDSDINDYDDDDANMSLHDYLATIPEIVEFMSEEERGKIDDDDFAGPHRSFPINSPEHVKSAARLVGHADDPAAVKAAIIRIAKRNGWEDHLPASWKEGGEDSANMSRNDTVSPEKQAVYAHILSQNTPTADTSRQKGTNAMSRIGDKLKALFGLAGVPQEHVDQLKDEDLADFVRTEARNAAPDIADSAEFTALRDENERLKALLEEQAEQSAEFSRKFAEQEAEATFSQNCNELDKLSAQPFARITPDEAVEYAKLAKEDPAAFSKVLPILQAKPVMAQFAKDDRRDYQRMGGAASGGDNPAAALDTKTRERMKETKEPYHVAFGKVCDENKDLAAAHFASGGN